MNLFIELATFIRDWWPLVTALVGIGIAAYNGVHLINQTLLEIKHQLELMNNRFQLTEDEQRKIWTRIEHHDEVIDTLVVDMATAKDNIQDNKDAVNELRKGGK
ncbi:MAG: hypothetical protein Q4A55_06570 [Aerococcus sp.]|nr:hypothetical protein [Aerococcus sp.]